MKNIKTITPLAISIAVLSLGAATMGIFSSGGFGSYEFTTIHGQSVTLWGKGIYQHMSAELAPQGIAQDVVTLLLGIPLLLASLRMARSGSKKGRILLSGTLAYFMVTYVFYLLMSTYNQLFLLYVALASLSFFAFTLSMLSFNVKKLHYHFTKQLPFKPAGGFLLISAFAIAALWLSRIVAPLLDGSIYPPELQHYTTLVVQALDLAILLPAAIISGLLLIRKKAFGYLLAPVYLVFLSLMMTALTAKVVAMVMVGTAVSLPVMLIIPLFNIAAVACTLLVLRSCIEKSPVPVCTTNPWVVLEERKSSIYIFTD
ncbi:hypothetical protein [Cesiribacter sp. SM1]|uniref:hypothetical protein n=1 Tax=Cesiribacter sp. SM1 TaxID=2861196 RepID=UPI001CD5CABE|nr:hypothetical protein [Cesiribacter sp. SM1]